MASTSLIEQIQVAPELFEISKWLILILSTALISVVGFTLHLIYGRQKNNEKKTTEIDKELEALKLLLVKDYVTYYEMKENIGSICSRLMTIEEHLRPQQQRDF